MNKLTRRALALGLALGSFAALAEPVKIGFVIKQPDEAWFQDEWRFAEQAAKDKGFKLVKIAAQDGDKLLAAIDNLAAQRVQGFVVCVPDVKLGPAVVARARQAGLKLMTVDDRLVNGAGKVIESVPHVGISAAAIGEQVGQALAAEVKKRGWNWKDVGAIRVTYDQLATSKERTDGASAVLGRAGLPPAQIFNAPMPKADTENAFNAASAVLTQHPQFKHWIAFGPNDEAVLGAVRAGEGKGLRADRMVGVGIGGSAAALNEFAKAETTAFMATVMISPRRHGYDTALAMYQWVSSGQAPAPLTLTSGEVADRANVREVRAPGPVKSEPQMVELEFRALAKQYPGVRALDGVSLRLRGGQVHALMGENGAGKSTLLKILSGDLQADGGELWLDGQPLRLRSAADALAAGIAVIHQELQYVPEMTVFENLLLGRLPQRFGFVRSASAVREIAARLDAMGVPLPLNAKLRELSTGQRQMVEICKALLRDARVIALDEPTSSLSHREAEQLFRLVRELRSAGKALVYVSHRMDEIFALCDGATVLRDGRSVAEFESLARIDRETLVQAMIGRAIDNIYGWAPRPQGAVRLKVQGLRSARMRAPLSFEARHGEILGFFGLVGAGRSELMRAIFGADARTEGQVLLDGQQLSGEIRAAIAAGLCFLSEDRKEDGIISGRSVAENLNVSSRRHSARLGWIDAPAEARVAARFIERLRIRCSGPDQEVQRLSGGNQQKVLLARWLSEQQLKVLVVDEPTRGIDIGAKREIYEVLHGLADQGVTVIVVSSELPEVQGLSDRVVVMRDGRIVAELERSAASEARVLELAFPPGDTSVREAA